jgi:hypothetical protein
MVTRASDHQWHHPPYQLGLLNRNSRISKDRSASNILNFKVLEEYGLPRITMTVLESTETKGKKIINPNGKGKKLKNHCKLNFWLKNSLGAICVLPASMVMWVGRFKDFALPCIRKVNLDIPNQVFDHVLIFGLVSELK